jgi:hypothetical protein
MSTSSSSKKAHHFWKRRFYDNFMFEKRQSFDHRNIGVIESFSLYISMIERLAFFKHKNMSGGAFLLELDIRI